MHDSLTSLLESHCDLSEVADRGHLQIDWAALHRFDALLANQVRSDPLAVADSICDALEGTAGIDTDALDVHVDGVGQRRVATDGGQPEDDSEEWDWDHEVVVDSVDEVTPVPIECPGCGERFREAMTDKLGGTTCHGCNDWIRYVRRHEIRDRGRSSDDTTEQSTLLETDGGEDTGDDREIRADGGHDDVIYRPKNCGDQSFSAYNVATWGKLCGQKVRHEKYGIGVVERSNDMSREAWVRFDDLRVVKLGELEVLAEDGGVRDQDLRADGGTVTDHAGDPVPAEYDGVDLKHDGCPVCGHETFVEERAGYYSCEECLNVWAGDPEDASIACYVGEPDDADEHTHYCEDCETELAILYDDRDDESTPIVCGHCGGTNTRPLEDGRRVATDGGGDASPSRTEQKETVTVTFLTNHEIDPDEFDLRVKDPDKIRRQLMNAANSTGSIQQVAGNSEENLQRLRNRVKKAKQSDRSTDPDSDDANGGDHE